MEGLRTMLQKLREESRSIDELNSTPPLADPTGSSDTVIMFEQCQPPVLWNSEPGTQMEKNMELGAQMEKKGKNKRKNVGGDILERNLGQRNLQRQETKSMQYWESKLPSKGFDPCRKIILKRKVPDELLCEYFFPNGLKAHSYKKTMPGELLTKLEKLYHTIYNRTLDVTTPISTLLCRSFLLRYVRMESVNFAHFAYQEDLRLSKSRAYVEKTANANFKDLIHFQAESQDAIVRQKPESDVQLHEYIQKIEEMAIEQLAALNKKLNNLLAMTLEIKKSYLGLSSDSTQ